MTDRPCIYCQQALLPHETLLWHPACAAEQRAKRAPAKEPNAVPPSWTWVHPKEKRGFPKKKGS